MGSRKGRWEKKTNEGGLLGEMAEEIISGAGSGGAGVEFQQYQAAGTLKIQRIPTLLALLSG